MNYRGVFLFLFLASTLLGAGPARAQNFCSEAFSNIHTIIDSGLLKRRAFYGFQGSVFKENNKFIQAVKENRLDGMTFFRVENRIMKELNDSILKNKGESYSLSISFQELFLRELRETEPQLYAKVGLQYHDYKSLNVGFKNLDDKRSIEDVYHRANAKFSSKLESALAEKGVRPPPHAKNLEHWMIGGFGATPDKASLVTKLSRASPGKVRTFSELSHEYQELLFKKSSKWSAIQDQVADQSLYKTWSDGDVTLNLDIINLARKSPGKLEFSREAKKVFPQLIKKDANIIYEYIDTIDKFAASVMTPGTVSLSPNATTGIVYSVDIGQMGAEGLMETMKAINRFDGIDDVLLASREAFWKADKKLGSFYEHVERGFGKELDFSLAQYASHTSGDDALFVFDDALNYLKKREQSLLKNGAPTEELASVRKSIQDYNQKWKTYRESGFDNYFKRVTNHPEASRLRVTSVKPTYSSTGELVKRSELSSLIEIAEGAEKYIRKSLLKVPELGPNRASSIFIGIETSPISASSFQHRLVLINKTQLKNSKVEELISQSYKDYLNSINHQKSFLSPRLSLLD